MRFVEQTFALILLSGAVHAADGPAQYTGPGSCSSSSCHGGVAKAAAIYLELGERRFLTPSVSPTRRRARIGWHTARCRF
jgi:hypothetical protein